MKGLLPATECGEVGGEDGTRPRPCHVHHTTQYLGYRVKVARVLAPNIILCLLTIPEKDCTLLYPIQSLFLK